MYLGDKKLAAKLAILNYVHRNAGADQDSIAAELQDKIDELPISLRMMLFEFQNDGLLETEHSGMEELYHITQLGRQVRRDLVAVLETKNKDDDLGMGGGAMSFG